MTHRSRILGLLAPSVLALVGCTSDDSTTGTLTPVDSGLCLSCHDASFPDAQAADSSTPDAEEPDGTLNDGATLDSSVATPAPEFVWYVLDETSGTIAHDSSAHHFDVANLTGVTWNAGATFDGTGGGGSVAVDTSYRQPPVTIAAWLTPVARADSTSTIGALNPYPPNALSGDVQDYFGFGIGLNVWTDGDAGSALAAEDVDTCTQLGLCVASATQNAADAGHSCTSASTCDQGFVAGTEYFVAVTIAAAPDGGTTTHAQVFVNGALFDDTTAAVPPTAPSAVLYLGMHNTDTSYGTKRFFDGRIRDVRIYQRAVDPTELTQLYTNGPTLHAPPPFDAGTPDAGDSDSGALDAASE